MLNDRPFITKSTIEALGYIFANSEEENMFLDFANHLFAKTVGRALVEQLPEPEAARLKSQKGLSEGEALKALKENHVDINQAIEEVREEFLTVLSDKRHDVMQSSKMKSKRKT